MKTNSFHVKSQNSSYNQPNKSFEEYDEFNRMSLDDINRELDQNINDIIILLNRRKSLIMNKKRRLREEFVNKINEVKRYNQDDYVQDLNRTDDPIVQSLIQQKSLGKMQKMMQTVMKDTIQDRKNFELTRSQEFWNGNKVIESEIDTLLKRLKYYDSELDKDNSEIYEICRQLDAIDEQIKDLLISKLQDNVQRAEPLFANKQKQQQFLNGKLHQRNKLKDEKMALIHRIIEELLKLRGLREDRMTKLNLVFGEDDPYNETPKLQQFNEFLDQLDNLQKMRDSIAQLESQEQQILSELDRISKENDIIFNEMIKKQSEEAKVFTDWTDNLKKRLRYIKGNDYFYQTVRIPEQMDLRELVRKFKDSMTAMKPLVEEESTIRTGLNKTNETISTFRAILVAIQNEKERRRELLNILESCARMRLEEDNKTEQLRNLELEITKKTQQKKNLEEDLDGVLGDADLNTFKKTQQLMNDYDIEIGHLNQQKRKIIKELEDINSDVIGQIARIKNDYEDILKEILPQNWMNTYDLKKLTDLKHMKNYLKKTFKRFGIISD
ncbi:hypothetical protein pb186bvf_013644 [Paramecium bursaria]